MAELFGWTIEKKVPEKKLPALTPPESDDGSVMVSAGGVYGTVVDLDGTIRTEAELIDKYRQMAEYPAVDYAIDDITNEAIVVEGNEDIVTMEFNEDIPIPDSIKDNIREEFDHVLKMLDFKSSAYELFRRWYVDGRLYYELVIDKQDTAVGVQEVRYIDPRKIRKIKEVKKERDKRTQATKAEVSSEYYVYNEKGFSKTLPSNSGNYNSAQGVKISKDAVVYVTSGRISAKGDMILSYLHKAMKVLNQLKTMEDALTIYRITRAPERRIFYIDVGNLPKMKAEQYLRDIMTRFKNKVVYDSQTGEVRDDRKFMTMLEDFWLPRREGGRGTEISTLPGGQNLGQMDDVTYFKQLLYQALSIPVSRLDPQGVFTLGRATEISRDEIKFKKFIDRVRTRFSTLFSKILEKHLVLKGVLTPEDWKQIENAITYKYASDSFFDELKTTEIMQTRLTVLQQADPFVGKYFSPQWIKKEVLHMDEEEVERIDQENVEFLNSELARAQQEMIAMQQTQPDSGPPVNLEDAPPSGDKSAVQLNEALTKVLSSITPSD